MFSSVATMILLLSGGDVKTFLDRVVVRCLELLSIVARTPPKFGSSSSSESDSRVYFFCFRAKDARRALFRVDMVCLGYAVGVSNRHKQTR